MKTWKLAFLTAAVAAAFGLNACSKNDSNSNPPPPVPNTNNNVPQSTPSPTPSPTPSASSATLHIRPHMDTCLSQTPALCLVADDVNGKPERYIYGGIQGFNFQWGHSYVLDVNRTGSTYTLVKVESDQVARASDNFTVAIDKDIVQSVNATACDFKYGAIQFTTSNAANCVALKTALATGKGFSAHFTFTGDANKPILLQSIDAPGTANWQLVTVHDVIGGQPVIGLCGETAFSVLKDGSFTYLECEKVLTQGKLTADELSQLDSKASALAKSALLSRSCNDTKATSEHEVYLGTDQADLFNIWRADANGTCFRGEMASTQQLETFVAGLKSHYAPVHALPGASPSPTPSATP